jgi:GNAT superfamily N-acetyltransferase
LPKRIDPPSPRRPSEADPRCPRLPRLTPDFERPARQDARVRNARYTGPLAAERQARGAFLTNSGRWSERSLAVMARSQPLISTDGVVTLKPPRRGDARLLVEGRDEQFFRWVGPGAEVPSPAACVWVGDELVGWVDYDLDHEWLKPGEVNVGYYLFPAARGKGFASRAVELMLLHLQRDTEHTVATLVIHPDNTRSLALARRLEFEEAGEVGENLFFTRQI